MTQTTDQEITTRIILTDVIILGGLSRKSNQQWVEDLTAKLQSAFPYVKYHTLRYDHWNTDDNNFDPDKEKKKLEQEIAKIDGNYMIVAKSIGSIITIESVIAGTIAPKFSVLIGFPLKDSSDNEKNAQERYAQLLQRYQISSFIIQNPDERYIHPQRLTDLLETLKIETIKVLEGYNGKEHNYNIDCVRDYLSLTL